MAKSTRLGDKRYAPNAVISPRRAGRAASTFGHGADPFANAQPGEATALGALWRAFKPHFPVGAGPWRERGLRAAWVF